MNKKEKAKQESREYLLKILKPGDTVHTILRSVSASGMNRKISLVVNGENISWHVAALFGEKPVDKFGHWALNCSGCGMDMGFHAVYGLGRLLFPEGFKPRDAGRDYGRNMTSADAVDKDGGYALNQKWL